jgi:hypothetical protein
MCLDEYGRLSKSVWDGAFAVLQPDTACAPLMRIRQRLPATIALTMRCFPCVASAIFQRVAGGADIDQRACSSFVSTRPNKNHMCFEQMRRSLLTSFNAAFRLFFSPCTYRHAFLA